MRKIVLFSLLLGTSVAYGQQDYPRDITLSWLNASQYVDGTAIEAGDLTGVKIDCFRQNNTVPIFSAIVPALGEGAAQEELFTAVIPNPGTYTCYGYSVVVGDIYSDASEPTFKKFVGKPNKPATFKFK